MKEFIKYSFYLLFLFTTISFGQAKKWTLEECVAYAMQNNISIKQSELDNKLSEITKKDAFGNFLPNVSAQGSHSWNIGLNQNITTGLLENQTTQFTSAGLNVNVDIYKGLQNQNQLRKANLSIIAAQYQLTKMQEDVSLNVVNAYLQILFNKENLKVTIEQLAFDKKQLIRTTELVDAGSIARGDLLDVKATVALDEQRKIAAENALLLSKLSMAQLLQLKEFEEFDILDSEIKAKDTGILLQEPKNIFSKAKETRTQLKLAATNVEIAQKDLAIARGAYMPTLQGFYGFSTRASNAKRFVGFEPNLTNPFSQTGNLVNIGGTVYPVLQPNVNPILGDAEGIIKQFDNNKGQNFGFNLNVPIFNGFAVRNNVDRSKIALERSKIALEQQELDLQRTVFTAYTDTKGAQKTYESAVSTLEARQKSFNYAKERYEVGLMNVFDFNQAQTLFVNAQSEVLRTKYDYIFRTKILEFYFGIPIIQKQ
jgi:outer membrane protein